MRPSPNAPLGHLSSTDRALFYQYGIGPSRAVHIPVIHHSFEHHARTQPQAIAVEDTPSNQTITFAGLDVCSDRLAHVLRKNNIRPGARVCILARRSIPLVAGILAILKSGGQYVPLDAVTITDDTLQFVLEDATPTVVLCMEEFRHRLDFSTVPVISLEPTLAEEEEKNPTPSKVEDIVTPEDGAYCIYTSGTTGRPKGVDVRHRGVTNVISGSPGNVGMRPGLRVAQLLNIAFDMGAWEILGSLYNGCTLCLRGNRFKEWVALLKTVDVVIATPSILTCHDPADYPNLKHVIVGGEPCPQTLADKWARHTQFNNCCGPTEISICNTVQPHTPGYSLSIGKPIPNTNVYILGRDPMNTRANAIGQVGCMWVGGIGVSNGYLNMPEKTAERWRKDPFIEGGMMFNTGDLGRWRKDGQLEHMGRADDQVKVKGFRIELDGVTMAMRTHEPVKNAVALLVGSELCGFVTPSTVDLAAVREATAKIQPYYAVPTRFLALEEFPMTRNGKIDKRELHALADAEKQRQALSSNPSSPMSPSGATSRITSPTGSTAISPSASTITERTTQKDASTHRRLPSITSVSITTTITSEGYAPDHSSFLLGATSETLTAAALFGMGDSAWNWKSPSRLTVVLLFITLGLCSRSLSSFL